MASRVRNRGHIPSSLGVIVCLLVFFRLCECQSPSERKAIWTQCLLSLQSEYDSIVSRKIQGKNAILVDMVTHNNLGDSFIEFGEILLLNKSGNPVRRRCSPRSCDWDAVDESIKTDGRPPIILVNGGGNFGDLWSASLNHHRFIVRRFMKLPILFLPQSIWYGRRRLLEEDVALFGSHPDLTILTRDLPSLAIARDNFLNNTSELSPDGALMIGPIGHDDCKPVTDILIIKRKDKESLRALGNMKDHLSILEGKNISYIIDDWPCGLHVYPKKEMLRTWFKFEIGRKCLCRGKMVVTDRLHAVLLSTLMDLPHVHLDNSYRKVHSFRVAHFQPRKECRNSVLRAHRASSWKHAFQLAASQLLEL